LALLFSKYSFLVHHPVNRMTGTSLHVENGHRLLSARQFSQREELFVFLLQIKLSALIQLGVSPPSFDMCARNGVLYGSQKIH
jgi:hypothetical protein